MPKSLLHSVIWDEYVGTPPLTYEEFPKWLNHKNLDPVVVYDKDQEEEYRAKGYEQPGTSDPHAYLVAKATVKMDDAIRTMNADAEKKIRVMNEKVESKISESFIRLQDTIRHIVRREVKAALEVAAGPPVMVANGLPDKISEELFKPGLLTFVPHEVPKVESIDAPDVFFGIDFERKVADETIAATQAAVADIKRTTQDYIMESIRDMAKSH
jgi:hypothetical protein